MPRLHITELTSIGAVESGDNPEAEILFWKSTTTNPPEGRKNGGGPVDTLDLSSLDKETAEPILAFVAGLQKAATEADDKIAALEAKLEVEDEDDPLVDLPEPVAKAIAERDEQIAKAEAKAVAAEEAVAKLQDERLTERYTERAEALSNMLGNAADVAPILKALAKADQKAYDLLDARFDTLLTWDGMADLLREHGDNAATGRAVDKIAAYAAEIRKDNKKLTAADARAQAWRDHPELKTQAREEGD